MKLPSFVTKAAFAIGKHSPVILVTVGIVGVVASAVGACMATREVDAILEEHRKDMEIIETKTEYPDPDDPKKSLPVTDADRKKWRNNIRLRTGLKMVKLYGLPVLGMCLSIACIIGAHVILRKRNAVLTAALASTTKAFDEYRKRVSNKFGEEIERQIHYNMEPNGEPITVVDMDENGKTKKTKVQPYAINMENIVPEDNVIYFVKGYSDLWKDSDVYNENVIEGVIAGIREEYDRKRVPVFVNDIRKALEADDVKVKDVKVFLMEGEKAND